MLDPKNIFPIGIGTFPFDEEVWGKISEEKAINILLRANELGVNYFNSAYYYGKGRCESILGKAVKQMDRDQVIIATKVGTEFPSLGQSPKGIKKSVDSILSRMNLEYIDVLLLHFPDKKTPIQESMKTLMKLKDKGLIKHIGLSQHTLEDIQLARKVTDIDVLEYHFSLLTRENNQEIIDYAYQNKISTTVFKVIERGVLTNAFLSDDQGKIVELNRSYGMSSLDNSNLPQTQKLVENLSVIAAKLNITVAQLAIAWALHQKGVTLTLIGIRSMEYLYEDLKAVDIKLSKDALLKIETLLKSSNKLMI